MLNDGVGRKVISSLNSIQDKLRTVAVFLGALTILVGCASLPPLGDASVIELGLATQGDISRYIDAQKRFHRDMFDGATFSDDQGTIIASFSRDQYDEYLAHIGKSDELTFLDRLADGWPTLRLSFESSRPVVNSSDQLNSIELALCDEEGEERNIDSFRMIIWRGKVVTAKIHPDIKAALEAERAPQQYEILFNYTYRGLEPAQGSSGPLQPLSGDLCVAFIKYTMFRPPFRGEPMRISKEIVNRVINPVLASKPR